MQRPPVVIRRILPEEWPQLRKLRLAALETDPDAFGSTLARESKLPEARWKARAAEGADSRDAATLVAVGPEGQLVGLAAVTEDADGRNLYNMWVRPEWRNRGVGAALLDGALAWSAAGEREGRVRLEVNPEQASALALYRSRGFELTGRSRPLEHAPIKRVVEMERPAGPSRRKRAR